jgi:LPXTG-motif cell wall-anchored protein
VRTVPWSPRRAIVALLAIAMLSGPSVASAQESTIPEDGAGVSATPPVPLPGQHPRSEVPADLPNTGTDPRLLFLAGMAMTLLGSGLRLRTADADDY